MSSFSLLGVCKVRSVAKGFKTCEVTGLEVQAAQPVTHNIQLEVGDTATTVEVMAATPVLDQRSAEAGQVLRRSGTAAQERRSSA